MCFGNVLKKESSLSQTTQKWQTDTYPPHCTVVNKGIIIEILDFELGAFSENLRHIMTWRKGIFGLSLQKKKFQLRRKCVVKPIFFHFYLGNWTFSLIKSKPGLFHASHSFQALLLIVGVPGMSGRHGLIQVWI